MLAHARSLWAGFWWAPALPWLGYAVVLAPIGHLRWEHVAIALVVAVSAYGSARTRRFFLNSLPFFVLFLVYDAMRYVREVGVSGERVLCASLRDAELAWFGVGEGAARMTLNDLFVLHHAAAIDVLCAIPYGAYIPVMIGTWAWLYRRDDTAARRFAWIAFITHMLGFVTYHVAPAAPPWYVRQHGCAIDLMARPSTAGLARVDALLHISYFESLYSRGSAVFGALPSLHATYPLFGVLAGFRLMSPAVRVAQIAYAVTMIFAAVYLDHHYVIDVLLGVAYALIAFATVTLAWSRGERAPGCGIRAQESCRSS